MKVLVRVYWDRALALVSSAVGVLALILGWLGTSGTALSYKQVPYIVSGGLTGIVLIGIGGVLWLSADIRDEWRKLDALEASVRELTASRTELPPVERTLTHPSDPTVDGADRALQDPAAPKRSSQGVARGTRSRSARTPAGSKAARAVGVNNT